VESLMFRYSATAEACVIDDIAAYLCERVRAVVVVFNSHAGLVSEQDILRWCRYNMAIYKSLRVIEFVSSLSKSDSGKVMWRVLQDKKCLKTAA
jgi:fatty-acyl-CoA synthase